MAIFSLGSGLSACDGCAGKKPYTPFGVASSLPSAEPAGALPELPVPPAGSASFAAHKAELVPDATPTWQGSGLNLTAPDGRRFAQVLPADFDTNHSLDALAWLVPAPNAQGVAPGELWYFANGAPARQLSALPGFVPSGPECTLGATLNQTGEHSATLDVQATCTSQLIARAPTRALLIVSPSREHPLLLTLRAASAAPDETLNFQVDSSDQDHDGRDDVRLTASVGISGANEPASADLVWLDRAAGASRSASEPGASALRFATNVAHQARGKHPTAARDSVGNALRLLSGLCAEGGVTRLFDEDGAPFKCGDLSRVIDSLASTELLASLAQGDVLNAFSVLRRDGWYFSKLSTVQRKALERELLRAVTQLRADAPYAIHALPVQLAQPHYSPLWFESDGALLLQGDHEITRISADRATEEAASGDGGIPRWPLELAAPNGPRVLGAVHACDRSELLFNETDAQHPLLALPSRVLAARPASCAGHGTGPSISVAPLGFDDNGLEALLAGARITLSPPGKRPGSALPAMGTPRSPDARWLVTPTALGLLLVGERKELWQTATLQDHADAGRFSDCVVANDARAVACLDAGHALIFDRPKPSASTTHKSR